MTPKELRQNAFEKLESAKALFVAAHYDDACYLAGYTVELSLKARYCTRKGWLDFPDNHAEAKRRGAGQLLTHDLEELLKLSDAVTLQASSLHNIDWNRVSDWSAEQRYEPIGNVTREQAEVQLQETNRLFWELVLFEIVEKLLIVEREVSDVMGPFNFFALVEQQPQSNNWGVLVSAWWMAPDVKSKLANIADRMKAVLDDDLFHTIRTLFSICPHDDLVQRFHKLCRVEHHPRFITSHNFIIDRIMPSAFIITSIAHPCPTQLDSKKEQSQ